MISFTIQRVCRIGRRLFGVPCFLVAATLTLFTTPAVAIEVWNNVVAIAGGGVHSLALTNEGRVLGLGGTGEAGFGEATIPSELSNVVAVAAGGMHSLALKADGTVVGWGAGTNNTGIDPYFGQAMVPANATNVVAIAAGYLNSLALTAEGRVVGWGVYSDWGYFPVAVPNGLSNVVAIATGLTHGQALTARGVVFGWGSNSHGQTDTPSGLSNVVAIAAGWSHTLALTSDGRVVAWGNGGRGETNIPSGLSNVVAIAAGGSHSLALTLEGRVVGWGVYDINQQLIPVTIPDGLSNVVAIAAGDNHSLALKSDAPPTITVEPASQSVVAGGEVSFQMRAVILPGAPLLLYQWQKEGTRMPGQTNTTLLLGGVNGNHAGNYAVVVSNFAGQSITSSVAALTVNCLLNVSASTGGTVTRNPDLPAYAAPSPVALTATPAPGYGFIRWTGDATGSTNPLTVVMDTNKSITAFFASTVLTLATQGVGTISKVPDQPFYAVGDQVTLTATAGRWHVFSRWLDGVTDNPRVVTIGESNAYTAVFTPTTPLETVTIGGVSRLAPVGMPTVLVDGAFILTQSASARGSALVTLSTTFPSGTLLYTLDGSEPSFASLLYTGQFTVQKPSVLRTTAYNADFTQSVPGDPVSIVILPTLTGSTDGGGSVAIDPPAGPYFSNSLAVVTATPATGWTFLQWLGDAAGTNPAVNLSMTRSKTALAVFGTTLSTTVVAGGNIVSSPVSPWHPYGSQVRLTAVPATGNYLAFWANAAAGQTDNPLTFTITNANPTVTAVFASLGGTQTNALTVIPDGRGQVTLTPPGNRYRLNTNVVLQATPDAGQEFLGWTGAASGSENRLTVTMNSNKVITASFTKRPWLHGEGNPDLLSQDGFRLTLTGEFGAPYTILGSPNLLDWTVVGTVTNSYGTIQLTDPAGTNLPARFYRAVEN
jgi:hypothetical protein